MADEPTAYPEIPASRDDVTALRRWLIVVGVWAVAASAIGIIALINANDEKSNDSSKTDARITELERSLSERIQSLEDAVGKAAKPEDVAKLDSRLKDLRKDVTDAKDANDKEKSAVDDLDKRVEDVEKSAEDLEQNKQDKKSASQ